MRKYMKKQEEEGKPERWVVTGNSCDCLADTYPVCLTANSFETAKEIIAAMAGAEGS